MKKHNRRIIAIIFVLIVGLSENTFAASYKTIYKQFLTKKLSEWGDKRKWDGSRDYSYYLIKNIDNKGVPELIVQPPYTVCVGVRGFHEITIYTIRGGRIVKCGQVTQMPLGRVSYNSKYKGLDTEGTGTSGYTSHTLMIMKGTTLKSKKSCEAWGVGAAYFKQQGIKIYYDEGNGKGYERAYWVDGKNVKRSKWKSAMKKYFGKTMKSYKMKKLTKKNIQKIK